MEMFRQPDGAYTAIRDDGTTKNDIPDAVSAAQWLQKSWPINKGGNHMTTVGELMAALAKLDPNMDIYFMSTEDNAMHSVDTVTERNGVVIMVEDW